MKTKKTKINNTFLFQSYNEGVFSSNYDIYFHNFVLNKVSNSKLDK